MRTTTVVNKGKLVDLNKDVKRWTPILFQLVN